jgi:FkbM family methyltransferase
MKVFLDCGSRIGESVDRLCSTDPSAHSYDIHMFEPNPVCYDILCKNTHYEDCKKHQVAVSDHEGTARLWGCVKTNTSVGSTLEHSKAEWDKVSADDYLDVPTIDLSQFIKDNFKPEDCIILKLNVEGSEYCVLEGLLKSGVAEMIDTYFVDFHTQWLAPEFFEREKNLRLRFQEIGKPLNGWNY